MKRERSHQINKWHVKSIKNKKDNRRNKNEIELKNIQLKQICTIDYKKRKDLQILSDDIRTREREETELMLKEDILIQTCYSYNKLSSEYNKIAIDSLKTINDYTYNNNNIFNNGYIINRFDYRHAERDIRDVYNENGRNIPPIRIKSLENKN